ncbi:MAG: superoxide dismutase [Alphaproteobacteria bacterium]|nr:superoxide dismutase [Alphaproteobacteria bacterium]
MALELPPLPYAHDALVPYMSKETLEFHHDRHHAAYVTNGNNLLKGHALENKPIEEIVKASFGKEAGIFNNAAQVWNHTFFFDSMKPKGGSALPGELEKRIASDLGGVDKFKADFIQTCVTQFGSGWGWLVVKNGKLELSKTPNAENPMVHGATALLTCDVWEHAYYVDYRNRRPDFVKAFLDSMVDWGKVAARLAAAK